MTAPKENAVTAFYERYPWHYRGILLALGIALVTVVIKGCEAAFS